MAGRCRGDWRLFVLAGADGRDVQPGIGDVAEGGMGHDLCDPHRLFASLHHGLGIGPCRDVAVVDPTPDLPVLYRSRARRTDHRFAALRRLCFGTSHGRELELDRGFRWL